MFSKIPRRINLAMTLAKAKRACSTASQPIRDLSDQWKVFIRSEVFRQQLTQIKFVVALTGVYFVGMVLQLNDIKASIGRIDGRMEQLQVRVKHVEHQLDRLVGNSNNGGGGKDVKKEGGDGE